MAKSRSRWKVTQYIVRDFWGTTHREVASGTYRYRWQARVVAFWCSGAGATGLSEYACEITEVSDGR